MAFAPVSRRREWLVAALLGALALVYAVSAIEPIPVGVFQDDGVYVVLAKSLATGEGYRFLQIPGMPNATHYPPLYPAFLAALWKLWPAFPGNVVLFKFANAVLTGLAAALTFTFARRRVGLDLVPAALATAAFTACAPVVLITVMVLSEPLFLVGLIGALFAAERAADSGRPRDAVLAGVAGGLLALVRTLGVVVVPATALVLLWRRRWAAAALVVTSAVIVMLPWQLWVAAHAAELPPVLQGKYGPYASWVADAMRTEGPAWVARLVWFNLTQITAQGWATVTVQSMPDVRWIATAALIGLFALGWWQLVRRTPVAAWTVVGYLALVVAWPFMPARFTWGIWPLVGLVFALAIQRVLAWRPSRPMIALRWAAIATTVLLCAGYVRYNYHGTSRGWWTQVQRLSADRAQPFADWVTANTAPDDVLVTDDDLLIYLYTGRRTMPASTFTPQEHLVPQPVGVSTQAVRDLLRTYDVDYVLASSQYAKSAVLALVEADPPELRWIRTLPTGAVFAPIARPRSDE